MDRPPWIPVWKLYHFGYHKLVSSWHVCFAGDAVVWPKCAQAFVRHAICLTLFCIRSNVSIVPFSHLNMTGRPSRQAELARSKSEDDILAESLPIAFILTIAVAVPKVTAN
jgi:hypothetical protein